MKNPSRTSRELIEEISTLKQRIRALEFSEAELARSRNFIENVEDACFEMDLLGNLVFCNEAFLKTAGYSYDEYMALSRWDRHPTREEAKRVFKIFDTVYKTGIPVKSIEYRSVRKDGIIMIAEVSISLVRDKSGNPSSFLCIGRDITDRKKAEEALRKSEEKFRLLVENSHDIIYMLNAEGVFSFVSPAWTTLLGHPITQVIGKSFQIFVHPDDISRCMVFLKAVIETGQRQDGVEYRVRHNDGTWYWHTSSAVPFKDELGKIIGFYGIAKDITKSKRAEYELRKTLDLLNAISESSTDAIYIKDTQGRYLLFNKEAARVTGKKPEEVIGKDDYFLFPADEAKIVMDGDRRVLENGNVSTYEEVVTTTGGKVTYLSIKGPLYDSEGNVFGIFGVARDITERKRTEKEREELILELQDALSKVKTLSGLLPICSCCKNIRDDKGYWNQVEEYVGEHTDARFSHSICPSCLKKYYPEFADDIINNKPENTKTVK